MHGCKVEALQPWRRAGPELKPAVPERVAREMDEASGPGRPKLTVQSVQPRAASVSD